MLKYFLIGHNLTPIVLIYLIPRYPNFCSQKLQDMYQFDSLLKLGFMKIYCSPLLYLAKLIDHHIVQIRFCLKSLQNSKTYEMECM